VSDSRVEAAGGVVWRATEGDAIEIAVVHRPRYDDWSLPKGKLDPGETFLDAARREVLEETGLECEVGDELPAVEYVDHRGRPKIVRYWSMRVTGGTFVANDEVDVLDWLAPEVAVERLSYPHDRSLIGAMAPRA
jgi:8-oxo-dGTP diphosphatase